MVRKCRRAGVADIAVMEVAQVAGAAEAMAAATATLTKKRKLNNEDVTSSSSCIQLRNQNRNFTVEDNGSKTASDCRNWSPNLDHDRDRVSTSCCSSNGSSEEVNERIKFVDLEDDESVEVETPTYYSCRERKETTTASASSIEAAESDDLDSSKAKCCSSEADSRRRSTVEEKMPTESETDYFFAEAEKQLLKQYSEKYNFDFVQEKPMEGRYEWIRLKP